MAAVRPPGPEVGEVVDGTLPGAEGSELRYRLYRPATPGPHPMVAYFHGGGWVLGSHDSDDPFCRDLCVRADAVIVDLRGNPGVLRLHLRRPVSLGGEVRAVEPIGNRQDDPTLRFGPVEIVANFENLLDVKQPDYSPLVRPAPTTGGRWTTGIRPVPTQPAPASVSLP